MRSGIRGSTMVSLGMVRLGIGAKLGSGLTLAWLLASGLDLPGLDLRGLGVFSPGLASSGLVMAQSVPVEQPVPRPPADRGVRPRSLPSVTNPARYPEGTFFSRLRGELSVSTSGDFVFIPSGSDESGGEQGSASPEKPLTLLPNMQLERLQAAVGFDDSSAEARSGLSPGQVRRDVRLSGQIFTYKEGMFLLVSAFSISAPTPGTAPAPGSAPAPGTAPGEGTKEPMPAQDSTRGASGEQAQPADPTTAELIREIESRRALPRGIDPPEPAPSPVTTPGTPGNERAPEGEDGRPQTTPTPGAPAASAALDGKLLSGRRGRIVRGRGGGFYFTSDTGFSGAQGEAGAKGEPAMGLLPCKTLEVMEARGAGDDRLEFRVSGRMFSWRGRTYLLPTLAEVVPPGDLTPRQ
ncbi:MAG: hypothetical protein SFZ23_01440 [Planctomycetota bacterium]|nr:hypothetical protein [Planctomycetota bacterium]